jgi:hypothetical protein
VVTRDVDYLTPNLMLSPTLWLVLLWPALIIGSLGEQQPFGEDSNLQESWTVTLSEHWDASI